MLYFRELRMKKYSNNFKKYRHFIEDAKAGDLPMITFTDPIYGEVLPWLKQYENDGHAQIGRSDYQKSEELLKEMYDALRSSPQWENLAWIITFDENGKTR
jgi:phospholipase C